MSGMGSRSVLSCELPSLFIKAAAYQREYTSAVLSGDWRLMQKSFITVAKAETPRMCSVLSMRRVFLLKSYMI